MKETGLPEQFRQEHDEGFESEKETFLDTASRQIEEARNDAGFEKDHHRAFSYFSQIVKIKDYDQYIHLLDQRDQDFMKHLSERSINFLMENMENFISYYLPLISQRGNEPRLLIKALKHDSSIAELSRYADRGFLSDEQSSILEERKKLIDNLESEYRVESDEESDKIAA